MATPDTQKSLGDRTHVRDQAQSSGGKQSPHRDSPRTLPSDGEPHYGEHGGGERRGHGHGGQAQYGDSSYGSPGYDAPTFTGNFGTPNDLTGQRQDHRGETLPGGSDADASRH